MTQAVIKSTPDEDLQYRSQQIRANNKEITTPIKAIDQSKVDTDVTLSRNVSGLTEIYFGLRKNKILNHLQGKDHSLDYSLNAITKKIKNPDKEIKLSFFEYKDEDFPSIKEIGYMVDQAYVYSDITPIPMLSNFTDRVSTVTTINEKKEFTPNDSKFEKFLTYLGNAIQIIEQRNNKPIMGYIPDYRYSFPELLDFYVKKGINTFYYDAHGSSPLTVQGTLRTLLRELNVQETLENCFIHMINPNYGRAAKDNSYIPAKDILGFGVGIDSLGEKHIPLRINKQVAEDMKKNPDNRARLFDKNSYGYLKTSDPKLIDQFYPNDSGIDIDYFKTGSKPSSKIQNSFNMEQLALESIKLKDRISKSQNILKYIEKKKNIKEEDLKILKKFKIKDKK